MQFKLLLPTLLIGMLFSNVSGQKSLPSFKKLTPHQLELKEVSFEKDASAVILDEDGFLDLSDGGYQLTTKRRIKILDESAINEGNIRLIFYGKDKIQHIGSVRAQAINLVNGEYVSTPVQDKDIYTVDINSLYKAVQFAVPNVKVGTIIEYQYILSSQPIYKIDAWEFQHDYPTLESTLKIKNMFSTGYGKLFSGNKLLSKYNNKIEGDTWTLNDIPSSKLIKYVLNPKNQLEAIYLQSSNLRHWTDLKKDLKDIYYLTENPSSVKSFANAISNGATEKETFDQVVNHFNNHFKWNKIYGIYASKSQKDIILERTGNQAELNLLFRQVLKQKGINADLVLLSSRKNGKLLTKYPFLQQFDNVVNKVVLNDGSSYLINIVDVPKNDYKYAPLYLFNDYGFVMDDGKEENFVQMHQFLSVHDVDFKYNFQDGKLKEVRKDHLTGYHYNEQISDAREMISTHVKSPVSMNYDGTSNAFQFKDGKYSITHQSEVNTSSLGTFYTLQNPLKNFISLYTFDEEKRLYPIEFNFPYYYKILVTSEIPDGFEVIISNKFNQTIRTNNQLIYSQTFAQKGNVLQVLYEFYLGQSNFPASDYQVLKEHFAKIQTEIQKEITLKKK